VFPGAAIVLTVLGLTLVGESMNDLNDSRLRGRRRAKSRPTTTGARPVATETPSNIEVMV
jgi:peptide/nickel transport system permease protein